MKRIVVTGATGFIGARLVHYLRSEPDVELHILGRRPVEDLPFHYCDLLTNDPAEPLSNIRPTHLIHLAWNGERRTIWNGVENLAWAWATLRLVLAFQAAGGIRAILAGSSAEYDWSFSLLDETTTPLNPATGYGLAKCTVFKLLSRQDILAPLSIGWARIFFPFGPFDKPDRLLSHVVDEVAAGRPAQCSEGSQRRPFIHVDDCALGLIALLNSTVEGAVNIALGETMSVRQFALTAAAEAGDASLLDFGAKPLRSGEPILMKAASDRLEIEVGFQPRFSITKGIQASVRERLRARDEPDKAV